MRTTSKRISIVAALIGAASIAMPGIAFAGTSTATITGGTLSMAAPTSPAFTATLTGIDQAALGWAVTDVSDNTGSAAGWNDTLTSTTFTAGSNTLADGSVTDLGSAGACDATATCTLATNTTSYPLTVPSAATAPAAVKILNASALTGLAGQTWTSNMSLALPSTVMAGSYSSTWTYSLVSAP